MLTESNPLSNINIEATHFSASLNEADKRYSSLVTQIKWALSSLLIVSLCVFFFPDRYKGFGLFISLIYNISPLIIFTQINSSNIRRSTYLSFGDTPQLNSIKLWAMVEIFFTATSSIVFSLFLQQLGLHKEIYTIFPIVLMIVWEIFSTHLESQVWSEYAKKIKFAIDSVIKNEIDEVSKEFLREIIQPIDRVFKISEIISFRFIVAIIIMILASSIIVFCI